ncbi:hypothetical protein B0H10DRAFT_1778131 [Mycena sp. CBHHK59/15]|nr:hypothetical protein B0H10DRAFT_1778131 [Mycena sp. CBHHK59/15]
MEQKCSAGPSKYRDGTESIGEGFNIESTYAEDHVQSIGKHRHTVGKRCECCAYADWLIPGFEKNTTRTENTPRPTRYDTPVSVSGTNVKEVFAGKKYKPVADKVRPVYSELPSEYSIERNITGDPLSDLKPLSPNPPKFTPTGRYTQE